MKSNLKMTMPAFTLLCVYIIIFAVLIMKLQGVIETSWLWLLSPFWIGLFAVALYLSFLKIVWTIHLFNRKRRERKEKDFDTSFFCAGCARPLPNAVRHPKGEEAYHEHCKLKQP